jgi:hypothetical protein
VETGSNRYAEPTEYRASPGTYREKSKSGMAALRLESPAVPDTRRQASHYFSSVSTKACTWSRNHLQVAICSRVSSTAYWR